MKTNEIPKRPVSSKPSKTRPSTSKPSAIKTEETQLETLTNNKKNTNVNISEEKIYESEEENISKSYLINKSRSTIEKIDFLDSLAKGSRKDSFINLLDEEAQRIDKINEQKNKLNYITLKENDIDGLYDWKTLFNHSRPLSHYTRINYKKPVVTEEEIKDDIKSPKILVDLPDDKMLYFFGPNAFGNSTSIKNKNKDGSTFRKKMNNNYNISNTISNNDKTQTLKSNRSNTKFRASSKIKSSRTLKSGKKNTKSEKGHNYIKPISIYSKFEPEVTFYFSNTFSDYYKEDLKTFTKKMPILKAKVKTNSKNLKKLINKQKISSFQKEQQYYDMLMKDSLVIKKQDLIISAERRNPVPLMKSIYKHENPDAVEIKENIRKYFNTMKPLGKDDGKTDYTKNDRWRLNRELVKFRKGKDKYNEEIKNSCYIKGKKRKLILSYYDSNDPQVQIFNNLNIDDEHKINHSFEFKNINNLDNNNIFIENVNDNNNNYISNNSYTIENKEEEKNKEDKLYKEKKEEKTKNKNINTDIKVKKRPRTGFKHSRDINILKNEKLKNSLYLNRPHSSNVRRKNILTENKLFDLNDYNELYKNYLPSNRFPVKTNSKLKSNSYNKINEMLKKRHMNKKSNPEYFITQTGANTISNYFSFDNYSCSDISEKSKKTQKIRPKTASGIRPNIKMNINLENSKIQFDNSSQKCNYLFFNRYINNTKDLDINNNRQYRGYFAPMNCFNKLAGKYYSSSINVHVKNKRNKRKEILDNYSGNYHRHRDFNKNKFYF